MNQDKNQLIAFLQTQLQEGTSEEELRNVLKKEGGWSDEDIDSALASAYVQLSDTEHTSDNNNDQPLSDGLTQEDAANSDMAPSQSESIKNPTVTKKTKKTAIVITAVAIVGLFIFGGIGYAYFKGYILSGAAPYTDDTLLRGIAEKITQIETVTYRMEGKLETQPRDSDAHPFVLDESSELVAQRKAQARDKTRIGHVDKIMRALRFAEMRNEMYPSTIKEVCGTDYSLNGCEYTDPKTDKEYKYNVTPDRKAFTLTIHLESQDAISYLQKHNSRINLSGTTLTLTQNNIGQYLRYGGPNKPAIQELGESARMLPPELNALFAVEASVDTKAVTPDFDFSLEGELDMTDMSYKVAFDVRRIGEDYFFQVRNMPGFFLVWLGVEKNRWVKISPDEVAEDDSMKYTFLGQMADEVADAEDEYTNDREEFQHYIKMVLRIAEREKLIILKEKPKLEEVGEQSLYRYSVGINKKALIPFIKGVMEEWDSNEMYDKYSDLYFDEELLEYLESDEFSQIFDYLDKNITLTVHVDDEGYPAQLQYGVRLVPPDTARQLADKQGYVTLTLSLEDINKPINVAVPQDAIPLKQLLDESRESMLLKTEETTPKTYNLSALSIDALKKFFEK